MLTRCGFLNRAQRFMLGLLFFSGQLSFGAPEQKNMSLYAVKYGESVYPAERLFKGDTSGKSLLIAWLFYAVKSGRETILIDTGFSDASDAKKFGVTLFPYQSALAAAGITPDSVTKIVLTHTHFDHAANLPLYPRATVIVNRREIGSDVLRTIGKDRLVTFGESYQVVPGMIVRRAGGHTGGSSYVELRIGEKTCLLSGDEAYLPENVSKRMPVGAFTDSAANLAFLTFAKNSGADVLTFHDPAIVKTGCVRQIVP